LIKNMPNGKYGVVIIYAKRYKHAIFVLDV
jgi:hypothetical protein